MVFSEGEEVFVKHSSSGEYSKGKILSVTGERYKIQFEPDVIQYVNSTDIKLSRPSRSVTRMSTRGKKSPSRHSPGRKSSRRRSAARSSSASRQPAKSMKLAKIALPRIEVAADASSNDPISREGAIDDEYSVESMPLQTRLKERGIITRRSTRLLASALKSESDHPMVMLTRNINRAVSLPLERKTQLHDFSMDEKERGHSVQRDQNLLKTINNEKDIDVNTVIEKRKKEMSMINEPQEWGGWLGSLILIVLSPLSIILPQFMCTESQCTFGYPILPKDLNSYINLKAFGIYLGFFLFVMMISITPIGKKIDGPQNRIGRLQYRLNGFLCGLLALCVFSACIYKEFEVTTLVIENYVQFSISGWIIGVILSFLLFIKGGNAPVANLNIQGSTNSVIYNFWQGREINPRIGPVDFKINLFRASMIAMILINFAIAMKAIGEAETYSLHQLNIGALIAALLQIIYAADALFFESAMLTTFEIMYEGAGYMLCTGYMLYPFLSTLVTKYMLYHKTEFSYHLALPLVTFTIGYLLYRISNSQKNELRNNPLSLSLSHLETIPTIRGKKLIVSGLWGHVRHPNYLGDIIIWWSISCISFAYDILPYYYAIMCTVLLVHRAIRDNERCKMRYGLAWEQYMSRVKYMILYRIF